MKIQILVFNLFCLMVLPAFATPHTTPPIEKIDPKKNVSVINQGFEQNKYAMGGSVVGNGAGLVENTFVFAFRMLPQLIQSCLSTINCVSTDADRQTLKNISVVLSTSLNSPINEKLIFVSENDQPAFFTTSANEPHRIAKTCLDVNCPIYINSDLLYSNGLPTMTYSMITGILVHELGHQAGYTDHNSLDSLAAQIRIFADTRYVNYTYPDDSKHIEFHQFNNEFPMKFGELYLALNGQSTRLTNSLLKEISQVAGWMGFELVNGHYLLNEDGFKNQIAFAIWAKVYYAAPQGGGSVQTRFLQFKIIAQLDGQIKDIQLVSN